MRAFRFEWGWGFGCQHYQEGLSTESRCLTCRFQILKQSFTLRIQYSLSTLQPSLFVCVHAGPSDCAFPVFLPHVGCFDKQTLTVAGAPCTNSLQALERSYSKCLGTVAVFQSPCSPATNSPARTHHHHHHLQLISVWFSLHQSCYISNSWGDLTHFVFLPH